VGIGSETCALADLMADGSPKHIFTYLQLRQIIQDEVFHLGFQLPRCHPPEGGYNWTPPITDYIATVPTLSILGEEEAEEFDL